MADLKEYYITGDDSQYGTPVYEVYNEVPGHICESLVQTFTTESSYILAQIRLKLWKSGSPGTLVIEIYATDGSGYPTGSALCSTTTNGNTLGSSPGAYRSITFATGATLISGTKYAIMLTAPDGVVDDAYVMWRFDVTSPTYSGGNGLVSAYLDGEFQGWISTFSGSEFDFMFIIYGNPPVPSAPKTPTPEHEATGITLDDTIISWEDGGGADTYDVYFRASGEFFTKIASDITDLYVSTLEALPNPTYVYGELYLWCVIAKNEYGSNYDPPVDFGIGYGGTIWEFNAMVFDPPLPSGVTLSYAGDDDGVPTGTPTGGNLVIAMRRLVAAANNKIWVEDI